MFRGGGVRIQGFGVLVLIVSRIQECRVVASQGSGFRVLVHYGVNLSFRFQVGFQGLACWGFTVV